MMIFCENLFAFLIGTSSCHSHGVRFFFLFVCFIEKREFLSLLRGSVNNGK